jgi:DNA modification methylase
MKKYRGTSEDAELMKHAKPVELSERFIESFKCDNVVDFFGGYGSTLIASEKLNKKCYMIEMEPKFCDLIIKRWEEFTGLKAVLQN